MKRQTPDKAAFFKAARNMRWISWIYQNGENPAVVKVEDWT
jgi:hypothetical protein